MPSRRHCHKLVRLPKLMFNNIGLEEYFGYVELQTANDTILDDELNVIYKDFSP